MRGRKLCFCVAGVVVLLDQLTKYLCAHANPCQFPVIPHCLSLTFVVNTGSIWGWAGAYTSLFAYTGLTLLFVLSAYFLAKPPAYPIWMGLLIGGVCGNTLDRLCRGYVIDFIDCYVKNWHWPCFNIADIAITSACIGMILFQPKPR